MNLTNQQRTADREMTIRTLDLQSLMDARSAAVISGHIAALLGEIDRLRAEVAAATATSNADSGQSEQTAPTDADTRTYWIAVAVPAADVDEDLGEAISAAASRAESVLQEERGYDASAWYARGHADAARSTAV